MTNTKKTVKKVFNVEVNRAWCKACGICIAFCPGKVFDADATGVPVISKPEACTGCRLCVLRCPDFATKVSGGELNAG
jgi:2-oxoglutarate ferredoxin oxidoreductase subunit delta